MEKQKIKAAAEKIVIVLLVITLVLGSELSGILALDMPAREAGATIEGQTDESAEESAGEATDGSGEAAAEEDQDAAPTETESTASAAQSSETETAQTVADNTISGVIWLDENEDGIMDKKEAGIADFPVSLYQGDEVVDTTRTDADGRYQFEALEAGEYVVAVRSEVIGEHEYLIPLCGISGDNMFVMTELADDEIAALSDSIKVSADTDVADINAGMRNPAAIMPTAGETYVVTQDSGGLLGETNDLAAAVALCPNNTPCTITMTKDDTISSSVTISSSKMITLTSSALTAPYTITQSATTTSTSGYAARHFYVQGSLTLEYVVLAGRGDTVSGTYNGGVYATGSNAELKLSTGAVIEKCSNFYGGGVRVQSSAVLKMTGGEISDNEAEEYGGGVYGNSGSLEMTSGLISVNVAEDYGGGVYIVDGKAALSGGDVSNNKAIDGAGVYVYGDTFTMSGGKVIDNEADNNGGGVFVEDGLFAMTTGTISDNEAVNNGGGVYIINGQTTIDGGLISDNNADFGGGGVYINNSDFTMQDVVISDNSAGDRGGGVYVNTYSDFVMKSGTISGNESVDYGGGVHGEDSDFTVTGGLITDNESLNGGGVYVTDGQYDMQAGTVYKNKARNGGGVYVIKGSFILSAAGLISDNESTNNGGGTYITNSTILIQGGEISDNTASYGGGGLYVNNCQFTMEGGLVSDNTASGRGGGAYVNTGSNFTMTDGTISGNSSADGGGVNIHGNEEGCSFTLAGGTISDNKGTNGGGVYVMDYSDFTIRSGTVEENKATTGGGVYVIDSDFTMEGGSVYNNDGRNGGDVYTSASEFVMKAGTINKNETENNGAGAYIIGSNFTIEKGVITENEAGAHGGGAFVNNSDFKLTDAGEISDNISADRGGGIYINTGSAFAMSDGTISGNSSSLGGGICVDASTFKMTDGEISDNKASEGGGIYAADYNYDNPVDLTAYSSLAIATPAEVKNNTASAKYVLPENYTLVTAFPGDLLNNYEINYKGDYLVTYMANNGTTEIYKQNAASGTGTVSVTLLSAIPSNFTEPTGYALAGWNTESDGSGTFYLPGDTENITDSITLYAIWERRSYAITEEYQLADGTKIQGDIIERVLYGDDYNKTAPVLRGYRYLGYQIDGGTLTSGSAVSIIAVDQDYTVTYVYEEYSEIIHVSVPVKLLWAAFESDGGNVTSPDYYFYNHSSHEISVTLQQLTVVYDDGLDLVSSTTAGSGLDEVELQLDPDPVSGTGWREISQISLMAGNYSDGLLGKIKAGDQGYFDIVGTYGGYFTGFDLSSGNYRQSEYEAIFRFELTH